MDRTTEIRQLLVDLRKLTFDVEENRWPSETIEDLQQRAETLLVNNGS